MVYNALRVNDLTFVNTKYLHISSILHTFAEK
nr:MAG TPA: hypothetical protein [Crassvirales sp.]